MVSILKSIRSIAKNRTTYRVGLLQAKAYRILKQETTATLKPFGISTLDWAFLGLLADNGSLRSLRIAEELGVEAPFITVMAHKLHKRGLVRVARGEKDRRVKTLALTEEGKRFIEDTEPLVREKIRPLIDGIKASDIGAYLIALEGIVRNGKKARESAS